MLNATKTSVFIRVFLLALLLVACGGTTEAPAAVEEEEIAPAAVEESGAAEEADEADEEDSAEEPAPEPTLPPLPKDRQNVEIIVPDGRVLEGYYYPAAINPAPIVVLMHWAGGDMEDWREIAPWLQNRQDEEAQWDGPIDQSISFQTRLAPSEPWLDPSWFPPMPDRWHVAVLIFNYGFFGASYGGDTPESWADDSLAAIHKAGELPGVDKEQIAAIGASIGADGAVDGCYLFNANGNSGTCVGAMSLSPGNYLTDIFTYAEAVKGLDDAGYPVWCLSSMFDSDSFETCESAQGNHYQTIYYPENQHGMGLIRPDYVPFEPPPSGDTLTTLLAFLAELSTMGLFGQQID